MNTDNPQQTVSNFEIGWLVGIIEGEGSVCLQISKRARMQSLRVEPRVIITNTDQELIEGVLSILDRLGIGKWVRHTKANNIKHSEESLVKKSYRDITYIHVTGFKRVARLLSILSQGMVGEKRNRAEVLLRFVKNRLETGGKNTSYSEESIQLMLEFLRMTKTKNYDKVAGMLNEHTRDGRKRPETIAKFSVARKAYWQKKRESDRRCALDLHESARDDRNVSSAA